MQLIPWTGMFAGAVLGALLEHQLGIKALFVSGLLAAILGVASLKIPHRWQLGYMPR